MSRKLTFSILTMLVLAFGGWAFFVPRPVFHAKPGFVRLISPGTTDVQIPFHEGMTIRDALKQVPAFAQFGVDEGLVVWAMTRPHHSVWSDINDATRDFLIRRTPSFWQEVAAYWPTSFGLPSPTYLKLEDKLFSGEAVEIQNRW